MIAIFYGATPTLGAGTKDVDSGRRYRLVVDSTLVNYIQMGEYCQKGNLYHWI